MPSKKRVNLRKIKQDINMLEYPLWMQDEKLPSRISSEKGFIWKDREGYVYRCGYKVPTKLDIIFLMYLLYCSQQQDWKEEIELSRYEILKSCGYRSYRPADYERLEDSLERWKMVGIKFQGTFYDGKRYIALSFGIIDTWKIDEQTKRLKIRFNKEWLTRIKNSSYFKYLNFDQIRTLRSPLAMRLYEILVKSFQNRDEWIIDVKKLANKIPMKETAVAHIIPKIKAAVNRINSNTHLKISLEIERLQRGEAILKFRKINDGQEPVIIEKGYPYLADKQVLKSLLEIIPERHRKKKTIKRIIEKAIRNKGEEYVRRNILYANTKVKKPGSYRVFLEKALKEDWALDWWEDSREENNLNLSRLKKDEREELIRKKVEEQLNSLSEQEKEALFQEAKEKLPESLRDIESFVRMQARLILRSRLEENEKATGPLFKRSKLNVV